VNRISKELVATMFGLASLQATAEQSPAHAPGQTNAQTSTQTSAQTSAFKVVQTPGGGQYIYGPLPGNGTMPEAIVYMLRQIHTYLGDRPEVGKFFQSRDGTNVSTFFTASAKTSSNEPVEGLLIVSRLPDGSASSGVILDERSRFGSTEPDMMKALSRVWQPAGSSQNAATASPAAQSSNAQSSNAQSSNVAASSAQHHAPGPLVRRTGGDGSASISLPSDWTLTSVASGTLSASGPNGEMLYLGGLYQGFAMSQDLFANFVTISNYYRQQAGKPAATYKLTSQTSVPGNAIQVLYTVDLHDGIGLRRGSARLGLWGPRAMSVNGSNLPEKVADAENDTLLAVIRSFQQNEQMMAQLRQGAMNRVQADAARANAQSEALNARREASNAAFDSHMNDLNAQSSSFDNHMDSIDRSSKMNQDYILDRSVVRDTGNGDRGTVNNNYADSLVRGNPERFQMVPNQDLIKGRDY
jgi:hypothetical protein